MQGRDKGVNGATRCFRSDISALYQLSLRTVKGIDAPGSSTTYEPCRVHSPLATIMFPITSEANAASRRHSTATTMSPASIDRPPTILEPTTRGPPRVYHPFSPAVIALLMPASVFG